MEDPQTSTKVGQVQMLPQQEWGVASQRDSNGSGTRA